MLDTIQKLTYRAKANIPHAVVELEERLCDRRELPLTGIHGERLYLPNWTGGPLSFRCYTIKSPNATVQQRASFWMPGLLLPLKVPVSPYSRSN